VSQAEAALPTAPPGGRPRAWTVLVLATVAFAALQVGHNRHLFTQPIYEHQDYAANSLLVIKAKREPVLHGHYSRMGFFHPGPALVYMLAVSEWVFHDWLGVVPAPHNAHMIGHILLNAILLAIPLAIVARAAGRWAALAAGLAFLVYFAREGQLACHWFAFTFFFVYLPFQVSAASVAAGRTAHLGWLALTASLAVHSHASFVAFVVPISLYALARLWVQSGCQLRELLARNRRAWVLFAAVTGLFVLPIALHSTLHFPGEIRKYIHYSRSKARQAGTANEAAQYLVKTLTNESKLGWPLAAGVGVAALVSALTFPARGRRFARQLLVVGALSSAMMSYYALRGVDDYKWTYLGFFYASVFLLGWILVAMRVALLVKRSAGRGALIAAGGVAAVWAATTGNFHNVYKGAPELPGLADAICADPRWHHGPPLMTIEGDAWSHGAGLLVQCERRGMRPWLLNSAWELAFTDVFRPDERPVSGMWHLDASHAGSPPAPVRRVWGQSEGVSFRELETRCPIDRPVTLGGWGRQPGAKPLFGWGPLNEHEHLVPVRGFAALLVDLEPCSARRVRLTINAEGLAPGATSVGQRVRVVINGESVGEVAFPLGSGERTLTFDGAVLARSSPVRIDFHFPDAHCYKRNRGSGPDERYSILLTRLMFAPGEP
jgi:hypothetical protein